ncbi:hypothetical protein ANCCEY_07069 [Ancylostoma ceylanicum]|uniref:Major facilitator superfamily (MFS) profile domain-containing protein n=1 Tax=Ancylostoma ceylanicum TaxID=53326 RepID=A0A0D6LP71_9BILA|nr:hypothetical protein ANCCEY_07069 [Ancylostoma ceylanicum]
MEQRSHGPPCLADRFFLKKVRWQISILAHIGFAISFAIRSNFGVAKNRMISNFTDAWGDHHEPEFSWTPTELGMMESSFFYGYAASQIPAGLLAAKFAPNKLFCLGVAIASILNVFVAFALQYHPYTDVVVMLTTVPWKTILLSPPVWAIVICNFSRSWTFFLLLSNQLTYMKDVLHLDIRHSGMISALPQFTMTIVVLISGQMADWLRSTGKMNTGPVRKMFNTLGFNVNHFDIAPRYASILMGFSNGFGALAGIGNFVTQHLTANNPSGWKYCFLLAMSIDVFGIIFFLIFGQGEVQLRWYATCRQEGERQKEQMMNHR